MSIAETNRSTSYLASADVSESNLNASTAVDAAISAVAKRVAPVWPLQDYVAVNPYLGWADHTWLDATNVLKSVSDIETLMDIGYYRKRFFAGEFSQLDIEEAIDELVADDVPSAENLSVAAIMSYLDGRGTTNSSDQSTERMKTVSEFIDQFEGTGWSKIIADEISKHFSAHYDDGQALWRRSSQDLPLYQAWHLAASRDLSFDLFGISGFRKFVSRLPSDPRAALAALLWQMEVPVSAWEHFLLCHAMATPGWAAWTRYKSEKCFECEDDFMAFLAIRLAYECALSKRSDFQVRWDALAAEVSRKRDEAIYPQKDVLIRYALLRATEIAYRRPLLNSLQTPAENSGPESELTQARPDAQMVFCIDVRSERYRRHLESVNGHIQTIGFAGFFGMPVSFVPFGETEGISQVPALISPQFELREELHDAAPELVKRTERFHSTTNALKQAWKEFQTSAASCFSFVETTGLVYGFKLFSRTLGFKPSASVSLGIPKRLLKQLGPSLRGLNQQGINTTAQVDLAESMLRGMGLVENFARLVVFCAHGCTTENNPLKATLDCGACGGHSGEPNARLAALVLNQKYIRQSLAERGIFIPDDTVFVAALHNTTTDQVKFFDTEEMPSTHASDLQKLATQTTSASELTRQERLPQMSGVDDVVRRSRDWSEVRPEWGLAGNAAFIAAPRDLSSSISLAGRSFLHSYDQRLDPDFAILEQIMTAPLIVANWINLQYYASIVDPNHFSSGNKAVHNVVGRFGILSGNDGDLMTGLAWQSLNDGHNDQHHPLRLLALIAAPRSAIDAILAKHQAVADLVTNGWLQLVAIEDGQFYRYTGQQSWNALSRDEACATA